MASMMSKRSSTAVAARTDGSARSDIVAYIIGIAVEIPFMSTTLYTGPAACAMNGTDLSWIVGLVITVPLYYLLASRQVTRRPAASPEPARN